jgi:general L-amino acid transport system substrate-binding protein
MTKTGTNLDGSNIAVIQSADYQYYLAKYMAQQGLSYTAVPYDNTLEMFEDYENGDVDAISYDKSVLNAYRSHFTTPGDHVIFDEELSKEPLSPVVRQGDDGWYDIVKWVIYALFQAEELGIDSSNVDNLKLNSQDPDIRRFLGVEGSLGQSLGLPDDWAYQIIKQVGNYAEIYTRNLESSMPTHLPRGKNKLHTEGGLMYSPPMR